MSIPGRVTAVQNGRAEVDVLGTRGLAGTGLVPEVRAGDYVLTSAGMVVAILSEDEALASLALFGELMELDQEQEDAP